MTATVTLIPGDGIGPEIVGAVLRVLEIAGADGAMGKARFGGIKWARTQRIAAKTE